MKLQLKSKVILKKGKVCLDDSISSLKRKISDYEAVRRAERKSEWINFREKYNASLDKIEENLKNFKSFSLK
jgi:hypothetical protein